MFVFYMLAEHNIYMKSLLLLKLFAFSIAVVTETHCDRYAFI